MVERFSSRFELPKATLTSKRASVYPLSVGEELSKMNALGRGQRERFRRCEVLRHRSTGGPEMKFRIIMPVRTVFLEPSVKSRARKKYHLSAGTNTVKFVYLGAPVREKSYGARSSNPECTVHRAKVIVVFSTEKVDVFRQRPLSLRGYPGLCSIAYIR